jgi:hypothetical protein
MMNAPAAAAPQQSNVIKRTKLIRASGIGTPQRAMISASQNRFPLLRDMLFLEHVLFAKPVPTFAGHAVLGACPFRKTGSHFCGTCSS